MGSKKLTNFFKTRGDADDIKKAGNGRPNEVKMSCCESDQNL